MIRKAMVLVALALMLAACGSPSRPAAVPPPAAGPTLSTTLQPTPSLAPSSTAYVPTIGPTPSDTPVPVISLTPQFYFIMPTPTRVASRELDCSVISQSVTDGSSFEAGERFTMGWNVRNTGTTTWYPASVEFVYTGGTKMHQSTPIHLQNSVPPGQTVGLSTDMRAPRNSSTYMTSWGLRRGADFFCPMRVTIWVIATPTPPTQPAP